MSILVLGSAVPVQSATVVTVKIKTSPASPMAAGFSGFNVPQPRNGVEYFDPKFLAVVQPMKPGWVRYPGGTTSLAFDWNPANPSGGHINVAWMNSLITGSPAAVTGQSARILTASQQLSQAKGGVSFSDFAAFANTLGAAAIICFNTYTDNNPGSATQMALAAQSYGLRVAEWELGNEAYLYPLIYPTAASYVTGLSPYFSDLASGGAASPIGLFYAGLFPGLTNGPAGPCSSAAACFPDWDNGLFNDPPQYWSAASNHIYPITSTLSNQNTMWTLNGILAHGSTDYINSYLVPLVGANTPIYITELNCCASYANKFLSYMYNGIFLAEYIARLSVVPNVKGVGVNSLYTDNADYHGLIQSVNDFETYLLGQLAIDPTFSTDTSVDPNTQFQFYMSAPALAVQVANQAINSGTQNLPTTVIGGPTVNIIGFDGAPIPAVYAQAYQPDSSHYNLLITNKSAQAQMVSILLNGHKVTDPLNVTSVGNTSPVAANTAQVPTNVQIQQVSSSNPVKIGPYSVTWVAW